MKKTINHLTQIASRLTYNLDTIVIKDTSDLRKRIRLADDNSDLNHNPPSWYKA